MGSRKMGVGKKTVSITRLGWELASDCRRQLSKARVGRRFRKVAGRTALTER